MASDNHQLDQHGDQLVRTRIRLDPRAFAGAANRNRTPGLHLTDVLRDIEGMLGRIKRTQNSFTEADLNDFALQGYLWEWAMSETLAGRVIESSGAAIGERAYVRLPELAIALDGSRAIELDPTWPAELRTMLAQGCVIMSPDGGIADAEGRRLLECKWCLKSARMDPHKDKPMWFEQAKCYLLGWSCVLGEVVDEVEWHVQFPVGEYWGDTTVYERWRRKYSQAQISGSWARVTGQINWRLTEQGGNDPYGWRAYL